jgi:hypothetical protein
VSEAERLNADAQVRFDGAVLQQALHSPGEEWYARVAERCPHLFADVPVFITSDQLQQMTQVVCAVERVVNSEQWIIDNEQLESGCREGLGVFYGYDFHLNEQGAHLIEINTNAGGAYLNALLVGSLCDETLPGAQAAQADLEQAFVDMFRREWQLARGDEPLLCIAIVDEQPDEQYLYPEFLLAQRQFEQAGISACIADPADLAVRENGVYLGERKIDLIYNRLTDFSLQYYPHLLLAYRQARVVLTPSPAQHARYADKRNLARLTDAEGLRRVSDADIATLQAGIPHTFVVQPGLEESLWNNRKQFFFKPYSGFGSRGAYRGDKLTRRVFGEIMQSGYVAQRLAAPGERCVNEGSTLKYDVRCYVYDGKIQLVAARLYQGQTTNFRTPGGGFAPVRVIG